MDIKKDFIENVILDSDCLPIKELIRFVLNNESLELENLIYNCAVGSHLKNKLNLEWHQKENCYFVNPREFFDWCIKKELHASRRMESKQERFYLSNFLCFYSFDLDFAFEKKDGELEKPRRPYATQKDRDFVVRFVELEIRLKPDISLESLMNNKYVKLAGTSYTSETVKSWILEAYPQFKRRRGRPSKSNPSQS